MNYDIKDLTKSLNDSRVRLVNTTQEVMNASDYNMLLLLLNEIKFIIGDIEDTIAIWEEC